MRARNPSYANRSLIHLIATSQSVQCLMPLTMSLPMSVIHSYAQIHGIFGSALCVNQMRLAFPSVLPCSDTSDFYDGWICGIILDVVVTVSIGVDF